MHLYRPDIDGLRAVAVLSVLAFHYGLPIPGGFTGVDVFFVISGFLITSRLNADIRAGTFSLLGFYDRRVRRILPALIVMLAATLLAGKFLLMPGDYKSLATSTAAAALGVSNLYFLSHTGYFDRAADLLPLLHTWSLAVEEQFYVIWPPLLFALAAGRKRIDTAALVGGLVIAGFAISLVWFDIDPKAAFFSAAPRAWELAIGALLVFLPSLSRAVGEAATIAGLALIGAGFFVVTAASFPGVAALYPCVGAALVIWPREQETSAGRLLGRLSPIGLISYSLYLWHWPVWVLFRIYINNGEPRIREALALAAVSIALSVLSYRFIEQPFRRRRWRSAQSVQAGLFACGAVFCAAMYVDSKDGLPERVPLVYAMRSLDAMWEWPCDKSRAVGDLEGTWCTFGAPWKEARTKGVLWGDSHAVHFAPLVDVAARPSGAAMILYEQCFPLSDGLTLQYHPYDKRPDIRKYCIGQRERIIAVLKAHPEINLVVIAASWMNSPKHVYVGREDGVLDLEKGRALVEQAFDDTIEQIQAPGRRIAIVTSIPQWSHDPVPCSVTNDGVLRRSCASDQLAIPRAEFDAQLPTVDIIKHVASRYPGTIVVSAGEKMCEGERCLAALHGEPLYSDESHMRRNLSEETVKQLSELIGMDAIFR